MNTSGYPLVNCYITNWKITIFPMIPHDSNGFHGPGSDIIHPDMILCLLYIIIYIYMVPCPVFPPPPMGWGGYDAPVVVYIHTYIPTYLPTYLHTYVHTYIHTYHYITLPYITLPYITFPYIPYIHTYLPLHYITLHYLTLPYITLPYIPYIHTYTDTHTYIHTYIHSYIHTYQHTYQHTNIPTYHHHRPQGGGTRRTIPPPQATGGGTRRTIPPPQATGGGPEEPDDTVHPYPLVGGEGGWPTLHHIYIYKSEWL